LLPALQTMTAEAQGAEGTREPIDFQALIETIPALVICALADGSAEFANRAWHEYTGRSSPERTGWSWQTAIHPNDLPKLIQEWTVAAAGMFETEARVRRADGEYQWFAIRKALAVSRDQVGKPSLRALIACEDIQERKQAQARLEQNEQRWQTAFENSPIGIMIRDRADRFLATNGAFRNMLGYTELELYQLRQTDVTYEEDRKLNLELIGELWEGNRQHFEFEKRYRRKDGTLVWARNNVALVAGTGGVAPFLFTIVEDITQFKKEESARRYIEQRYRVMVETASDAVVCMDENGAIVLANPATMRVFGYEPAELIGKPLTVLMPEFLRKLHEDDGFRRYLATGQRHINWQGTELTGLRKNGQEFPVEISLGEVTADGHRIFTSFVRDISERKRAEDERQAHLWSLESMDKINLAIQGSNDLNQMMSDVLDAVLSIFGCHRAWLGYPCDPESPSSRTVMERTRPEFPGACVLGVDFPMDAQLAHFHRLVRASSHAVRFGAGSDNPLPTWIAKRFSVQSQIVMAVYPKVDKPWLFGLDECTHARTWTHEEEQLFEAIGRRFADSLTSLLILRNLQESEARLEEAERIAHVGYWARDLDTGLLTWSDETYRIFGLQAHERPIDLAGLQELIHPEDRQVMTRAVADALGAGVRYEAEYRVVRPNGEVRFVHSQGDVKRNASGRPNLMFGTIQDITERKQAEEERERLRQAQADLAHLNRVTTMGELTASLAHEIKQPLTAALTNAETCLDWLGRDHPDIGEGYDAASRTKSDVSRAVEIVDRTKALFKKGIPERVPVDMNELIQDMVILLGKEAKLNSITIRTELAPNLPGISADRVQLQQVLMNLMVNAIDSMKTEANPRELTIKSEIADAQLVVSVSDVGIGLPPDIVDRIFDPFFTTKAQGTGMGLPISRSIVESHGGRLWATANSRNGATFRFTLPVVAAAHA
jgi:PAS domain S-box-containing protein